MTLLYIYMVGREGGREGGRKKGRQGRKEGSMANIYTYIFTIIIICTLTLAGHFVSMSSRILAQPLRAAPASISGSGSLSMVSHSRSIPGIISASPWAWIDNVLQLQYYILNEMSRHMCILTLSN